MNEKIVTEKGEQLDIRLPSVTGSMTYQLATENTTQQQQQQKPGQQQQLRAGTPHSLPAGKIRQIFLMNLPLRPK